MTLVTAPQAPAPERDLRGYLLVFFAGVLWSTVGLGIRLIDDALVWQILLYRSLSMSALLYVVIRLRTGRDPLALARASGWGGVIGGLSLVAAYTGGIYAVQSTSVANAMMLFASAPLLAAVLGRVILREMVRPQTWVAIAVASGGIAIMVWDKSSGAALRGNLAALGSALGFAVFTITLRWGKNTEMMPSVFISGLFAIAIMGGICLWLGLPLVISLPDTSIALGMGVFQVGAGLVLYTIGSKTVPAAELTLLSLAEVVLGPVWVWLVLGETASINTLIGGAVLLAAIAGNALSGARRKPPVVIV
ncbi:EamA domain-containing membrane protein RarD [Roseovarius marisflavi]|uniref:EamA domain-containing membrane protein RarD n=1 Tax=Roseovarius marisflavi TaxID=1054996 RepID=A0A1M6VPJ3_9RHOB|nr:DMT family transporter [Roseovarius marisflavi]SHK83156.1 EamA domain-containing membrane protein RarD [Roseovarius marisflavi]